MANRCPADIPPSHHPTHPSLFSPLIFLSVQIRSLNDSEYLSRVRQNHPQPKRSVYIYRGVWYHVKIDRRHQRRQPTWSGTRMGAAFCPSPPQFFIFSSLPPPSPRLSSVALASIYVCIHPPYIRHEPPVYATNSIQPELAAPQRCIAIHPKGVAMRAGCLLCRREHPARALAKLCAWGRHRCYPLRHSQCIECVRGKAQHHCRRDGQHADSRRNSQNSGGYFQGQEDLLPALPHCA